MVFLRLAEHFTEGIVLVRMLKQKGVLMDFAILLAVGGAILRISGFLTPVAALDEDTAPHNAQQAASIPQCMLA